ncbi:MAG: 30S ribosomal protein S20 [Legionellales bacterium]|nr:30S ribosomal protein S20 [Legionellales bacterium]
MANIKSAKKRARQNIKRRAQNNSQRSMLRTYIKKVVKAIETQDPQQAVAAYQQAQPIIDKAINKGLIHKNKAARHKSRLSRRIAELTATPSA